MCVTIYDLTYLPFLPVHEWIRLVPSVVGENQLPVQIEADGIVTPQTN